MLTRRGPIVRVAEACDDMRQPSSAVSALVADSLHVKVERLSQVLICEYHTMLRIALQILIGRGHGPPVDALCYPGRSELLCSHRVFRNNMNILTRFLQERHPRIHPISFSQSFSHVLGFCERVQGLHWFLKLRG